MFEENQLIGNYTIKRILTSEGAIQKYISEDPFFNTSVTLNVLDVRAFSQEQKHILFSFLQKLFSLEHETLLPVYDSGFESDYAFFTNAREQNSSFLQKLDKGLSTEEALYILRCIVSALATASSYKLTHGPLMVQHIYFSPTGQPFIDNFGIQHYYSAIKNNIDSDYPLKNILTDIGNLLSILKNSLIDKNKLSSSVTDNINNLSNRLKDNSEESIEKINEVLEIIDNILSFFKVEKKSIKTISEDSFNINKREDVLPFIRSVIEERNKLKIEVSDLNTINNENKIIIGESSKKIEEIISNNKILKVNYRNKNKRIFYMSMIFGFIIGIIISTICIYFFNYYKEDNLNNKNIESNIYDNQKNQISVFDKGFKDKHNEITVANTVAVNTPDLTEKSLQVAGQQYLVPEEPAGTERIPLKVMPEKIQSWWPEGEEFSDSASLEERIPRANSSLTMAESEAVFNQLRGWINAWEKQDIDKYLACYSVNFTPGGGRNLSAWKQIRRSRVISPDWIKVNIQNISMKKISDIEISAEFQQKYLSDSYEDLTKKVVTLSKQGNDWLITTEKSLN